MLPEELENFTENVKLANFTCSLVFKVLVCKTEIEKKLRVTNKLILNPQNLNTHLVSKTVSELGSGLDGKIEKYTAIRAALLK